MQRRHMAPVPLTAFSTLTSTLTAWQQARASLPQRRTPKRSTLISTHRSRAYCETVAIRQHDMNNSVKRKPDAGQQVPKQAPLCFNQLLVLNPDSHGHQAKSPFRKGSYTPNSNAGRCRLANDIAFSFSIKPVRHEFESERSKLIDTERESTASQRGRERIYFMEQPTLHLRP